MFKDNSYSSLISNETLAIFVPRDSDWTELGALAATHFIVNQEDRSGGSGTSFLVEWVAQKTVLPPVVESIMINTSGNQGISFISAGRVIQNRAAGK